MVYIFCRDQDLFTPVLIKFLRQTVLIYSLALIIALRYNRENKLGNDSNLLIVFYVQIVPDDFVMQLHR
ncbi:hypothetical protein ACQV49_14520, partial [Klebsiella pneumoniae]|uniref:hypothetical protein n=1 Tax=Klebsiella pneumoniae TaxID=573 RepID=UPI003D176C1C